MDMISNDTDGGDAAINDSQDRKELYIDDSDDDDSDI